MLQERGETIGDTVGYSIRLESRGGPHSSIMFCTNGVLLRMLTQGEGLQVRTCTCFSVCDVGIVLQASAVLEPQVIRLFNA